MSIRLDLGCGPNKREGFIGVDVLQFDGKVDVVTDLTKPWPWENDSVEEVHCSHTLEHFTMPERCHFARELARVLKPGAKATIITPHWMHERSYGDPTHQWPAVTFMMYLYWNKEWRARSAPHTNEMLEGVDFDVGAGFSIEESWQNRNDEMRMFAMTHYNNVCMDMIATVTKRPSP
jgi:predicted SAM-dependent methyltransferase